MQDSNLILEPVSVVVIPTTTSKFIANDKFVINAERNGKVLINHIGESFKVLFLGRNGKIEDSIAEQTLRCATLRRASIDLPIITKLGGEEKVEMTLSAVFCLMERQKYGEDGVLLKSYQQNIFFIRDFAGLLRTVCVYWNNIGWSIDAYSVESRWKWYAHGQVFSPDYTPNPIAMVA